MSNALTEARAALKVALEGAGFRVEQEVPQTFSPPLCWITPRSPYRVQGQTFSSKKVSLAVICLAAQGTNASTIEAAEDMASGVADAIEAMDGFKLDADEEIGVPGFYSSAQGQQYIGAPVNVTTNVFRD